MLSVYQLGDGIWSNFVNAFAWVFQIVKPMTVLITFYCLFCDIFAGGLFSVRSFLTGGLPVWMAFPFGLFSTGIMLWWRSTIKQRKKKL